MKDDWTTIFSDDVAKYVKKQQFVYEDNQLLSTNDEKSSKFSFGKNSSIKMLRSSRDNGLVLSEETDHYENVYFNFNMNLHAILLKNSNIDDIIDALVTDLQRSLFQRLYSNILVPSDNLQKRVIVKDVKRLIPFPEYVLPKETSEEAKQRTINTFNLNAKTTFVDDSEAPFNWPIKKQKIKLVDQVRPGYISVDESEKNLELETEIVANKRQTITANKHFKLGIMGVLIIAILLARVFAVYYLG